MFFWPGPEKTLAPFGINSWERRIGDPAAPEATVFRPANVSGRGQKTTDSYGAGIPTRYGAELPDEY